MSKNPALTKEGLTALIFLALLVFVFWGEGPEKSPQGESSKTKQADKQERKDFTPSPSWHELDKSEEMQRTRKDLIESYKKTDIIAHIGDMVGYSRKVYVGNAWGDMKFRLKKTCVSNIFTYYFAKNPKLMSVTLKDPHTGQKVGEYSHHAGRGALSLGH